MPDMLDDPATMTPSQHRRKITASLAKGVLRLRSVAQIPPSSASTASTTTGSTASWAAPSPHPSRARSSSVRTPSRFRVRASGCPSYKGRGDEQTTDAAPGGARRAERPPLPQVRLPAFSGGLHARWIGRPDRAAAGVPALGSSRDHVRARSILIG